MVSAIVYCIVVLLGHTVGRYSQQLLEVVYRFMIAIVKDINKERVVIATTLFVLF